MATTAGVLANRERWAVECSDALAFLAALPDDSVDLLITSPPYERQRTYGLSAKMVGGEDWVRWMFAVVTAAAPKVKGLIAINCEGQTRDFSYSGVPFLLLADLKRAGFNVRKPCVFHRVGIPGSGGPDWFRNDWEPVVCVTRPGKLPWSDNTACGHPPKWAPGGEMSHRITNGMRVNQWGHRGEGPTASPRAADGKRQHRVKPSQVVTTGRKVMTLKRDGMHNQDQDYQEPVLANPGNVIEEASDFVHTTVGGGQMGHALASENEAPFPVELVERFVLSFCPPGGVVCDPFSGGGTVCHVAVEHGRRFVGCDLRQSQVDLCARRMATVTPSMFSGVV